MAMILGAFVGKCVEKLVSLIEEKAIMMLGIKEDLRKMQRLMIRIQDVLEDAEQRRMEDRAIDNWLSELRDVMYDADDIFDHCLIEDEHPSSSSNSGWNFSFPGCFLNAPHRYEIGERISSLYGRLNEIYEDMQRLNLNVQNPKTDVTKVNRRQTDPTMVEVEVVGREIEDATKDLIKLMTGGEVRKSAVFAITGMGGIGKTTLAGKIFNHRKIQTKFEMKAWVCISQNYNEIELLKQVIRGAGAGYGDANSRAELAPLLRSAVTGKSIFLVLDDVWRADVWIDLLRSPLHTVRTDSLILITTRDENVAKQMGSAYIHRVNKLPVETGWEMLSRSLVMLGKGEEEEIDNLREIGIQIIKKCDGLPLAIKAMAGVLSSKEPLVTEWKKILKNSAWSMTKLPEEISGAIYLSYADLPSPLKQCFLYCSLFPEDCKIALSKIVRMWVAEGFIKEEGDSLMEDTAEDYFYELTRRNLLQPSYFPGYKSNILQLDTLAFKVHDLFRALGLFICRDESFSGNVIEKSDMPLTKLRRVALTGGGNAADVHDAKTELKCLRTLINRGGPTLDFKLLVRFLHLRVIDLSENEIECIPDSIGDLVHLRYLNLNQTLIRQLPESIGRLSNLQYLYLAQCKHLTILPQSITQLQKLRTLALYETPLISFIPKGIKRLKQLNTFTGFVVGDDSVSNKEEHSTLRELSLGSYLPYLSILSLSNNISTPHLPPLGQLPNLRILVISGSDAVKRIGPEFLGGGVPAARSKHRTAFPMLQALFIFDMNNLEEWFFSNEEEDENDDSQKLELFPLIDYLSISNFPKLRSLPSGLGRTGLKKLQIRRANSLKEVENLTRIEWVDLRENPSLERISNLHVLKCLKVSDCYALKYVESLNGLLRLLEVRLRGREAQDDDDDDFLLQLSCNEGVLRRCLRGGEGWAFIQQIPRLNANKGRRYLRFVKQPFFYETNI